MKTKQTDDQLRQLFARGMREEVSPVFTAQLIGSLCDERQIMPPSGSFMAKWVGKVTIGVALASNALVLSRLHIFAAPNEMFYATFAFVFGAFAVIIFMKASEGRRSFM